MVGVIAVINAGSSSLKFCVYFHRARGLEPALRGQIESIHTEPRFKARDAAGAEHGKTWPEGTALSHEGALHHVVDFVRAQLPDEPLLAVGHRVVHGGMEFAAPVRIDANVLARLEAFIPLAPLHQPHNLAAIRSLLAARPDLPQVACFDTAFHRSIPEIAQMFALPHALHVEGVRRFGFHGLSYEYIASRLPLFDPVAAAGRTVVLHLGNGASMCAMHAGRSVASTMGFTAVDGLPMGTRCGSIDPGVILYLMDERGMDARAIEKMIYNESGLLGVSGVSSDMRTLLASAEPGAKRAVDLYVYRIGRELGSLTAALGGLDAIVFTGGIGENSAVIRERVCRNAGWLGVDLDPEANDAGGPCISAAGSRARVWTVPTDEERMIARHTLSALEG
ncbi:acetate/propionate family kinase [Lysobacter sp. A6]|uniref:Acetate kinase n=1 Tax=Noviluteimonas lactosilytica TaxID=2888523 RepID=A0ABS8JLY1_9GAMM|nr:acetate/propionate family kinase [Lysobacter lactosilyticus]MCC8364628.1 acetate/propionate family kinase [Lysobacter lactosilyticus]